jgi:hypothetical protein
MAVRENATPLAFVEPCALCEHPVSTLEEATIDDAGRVCHEEVPVTREIALSRGLVALVDDEDYERLAQHRWYATTGPYAARKKDGKVIYMHREILGLVGRSSRVYADHKNRNTLDNRRSNLRMCTQTQNMGNVGPRRGRRFKGVSRRGGSWRAYINLQYRQIGLGAYTSEEDAARAYDAAALKYFGEFACLNFPVEVS